MTGIKILPDIPRLYTALAEWLACIICLAEIKHRITGKKFIVFAALVLLVQSIFLTATKNTDGILWILCMAVAVGIMYVFIYAAAQVHQREAVYFCMYAFVMAEFAASLEWQIDCYIMQRLEELGLWAHLLMLILIYGTVFVVLYKLYHPYGKDLEELKLTNQELFSCVVIGLAVFCISNLGFVSTGTIFGGRYEEEIFNVRTLVDLGGVAIMFAYHMQRVDIRVRHELQSIESLLHSQYMQYKQSREMMEVINYKYHDLKHHILALRAEENTEKQNEYLDQMEEELKDYETQNKTENKILDVLLATKNLYCRKHGITLTSVIDGALFEFMNAMDICSIFGNALDNAIECEMKISDKQKRLIHISAFSQRKFLIIRFENYVETEMVLGRDFPATTKNDAQFHGYGLKSIRYTVEKYGGAVHISTQDHWFILKILIPT